jgi:hypothetical protein
MRILLVLIVASACRPDPTAEAAPAPPPASAAGHYCDLGVFTKQEHARHRELVAKFKTLVRATHELPDGYSFDFPGAFKEAGEWLDGTRRCCPTLKFALEFSPQTGAATLRATFDAAAKPFIREEFAQLFGDG